MKYTDLKTVLAIYELRSFTNAARQMHISQSAVSQTVSQLESELNLSLFIRKNNSVIPTPACLQFVEQAKKIEGLWSDLEHSMKLQAQNASPALLIGTTSFFSRILSGQGGFFDSEPPGIKYQIIEDTASNIERMTAEGLLSFCFTRTPLSQPALEQEYLFTESILFAVPADHPVCSQYPPLTEDFPVIGLEQFKDSPFVMVNNPRITPSCTRLCEDSGFFPNMVYQSATWEHVYNLICMGRGVGFMSELHVRKENNPSVRFFRIQSKDAFLQHVVAYLSPEMITQEARKFIDGIKVLIKGQKTG